MGEIGGYIELERFGLPMLHEEGIKLNCGRNCLAYLILAKKIKKILLPYLLCDSVKSTCKKYAVEIRYYHVDMNFLPVDISLQEDEWLYIVDYYGQLSRGEMERIRDTYRNVIFDFSQAYFEQPVDGADSLYTCRKFFGVADGAVLFTDTLLDQPLMRDESFDRMRFLLGRFERTASEFYQEYVLNNQRFSDEPLKSMSALTENLLHGIDYEQAKRSRTENFAYLSERLAGMNQLTLRAAEGAYAYPLLLDEGNVLRKKLIEKKVYIPTLWPNVLADVEVGCLDHRLTAELLPIPCDHRYCIADMEALCTLILVYLD